MSKDPHRKSPMRQPPPHLSEFYSYVNSNSTATSAATATASNDSPFSSSNSHPHQHNNSNNNTSTSPDSSPLRLNTSARVPRNSTNYYSSPSKKSISSSTNSQMMHHHRKFTNQSSTISSIMSIQSSLTPSTMDLDTLITKNDVNQTIACYKDLVDTAKMYREALMVVSNAASEFGRALEDCARCKGSGQASDGLMTSSGLHYLIANHQQILAHSLENNFEGPVLDIISDFKKSYAENDLSFKTTIQDKVKSLKQNETANIKLSKKKTRNIISYKSNLLQLASQLDEIDKLKHDYYVSSFDHIQSSSLKILAKTSEIVSMETTIYENIGKKAWSGGGLDDLLDRFCPGDPFKNEESKKTAEYNETVADVTIKDDDDTVILLDGNGSTSTSLNHHEENDNKVSPSSTDGIQEEGQDEEGDQDFAGSEEADDTFYAPPIVNKSYSSSGSSSGLKGSSGTELDSKDEPAENITETQENPETISILKDISNIDTQSPTKEQPPIETGTHNSNGNDNDDEEDRDSSFSLPTATATPNVTTEAEDKKDNQFRNEWID